MRHYVFVHESADPIFTIEGVYTQPSYLVKAENLESAIARFAEMMEVDLDECQEDIDDSNITILVPALVEPAVNN